jgi:hypothetical protein
MVRMTDGTRCETKGNVKEIRACVKFHLMFKGLERSRLIFLAQEKEIIKLKARQRKQEKIGTISVNKEMYTHNTCYIHFIMLVVDSRPFHSFVYAQST